MAAAAAGTATATVICGATVHVLLEKALSFATDKVGVAYGVSKDLESLRGSIKMIQAVLVDAEDKQSRDPLVKLWLQKLERVAYEAYEALDELNYEILRSEVKSWNQPKGKVFFSFSIFSKHRVSTSRRQRMGVKVRDIIINLNNIKQEAQKFNFAKRMIFSRLSTTTTAGALTNQETHFIVDPNVVATTTNTVDPNHVVGRDDDKFKIVELLLSPTTETFVSILLIVGVRGLGKTTLAKLVFNDERIADHFDKTIWVCAPEMEFDETRIFELILEQLLRENMQPNNSEEAMEQLEMEESVQTNNSEDSILQKIQQEIEGKRYLLVLDNVWNENLDNFFKSLEGLSKMSGGSWCLITCRNERIASYLVDHNPYPLGKLSDDDCWSILKEKVAASGEVPQELIAIKKQVIRRCDGLPLVAEVLGSSLCKHRKEDWRWIAEKKPLDIVGDDCKQAVQKLKSSFNSLPLPIKKCFAYLSIFKEGTEMDRDDLIRLWMAEGFLRPDLASILEEDTEKDRVDLIQLWMEDERFLWPDLRNIFEEGTEIDGYGLIRLWMAERFLRSDLTRETTMEETGDKYLTFLLQKSLLQETRDDWGRVVYKLHGLVYDLAKSVSKNGTIVLEDDDLDSTYPILYLAVGSLAKLPENVFTGSVRTLFLKSGSGISDGNLSNFRNLHILKLFDLEIMELPNSIGTLKHMRYLQLSTPKMKTLPKSLCELYNLQTLRIDLFASSLQVFPKEMSNLISLRHLDYFSDDPHIQMPVEMGRMTCIQTLRFFNIGEGKGCGIEELGCLEQLQGNLSIRNLELVKEQKAAIRAKLSKKKNLIGLELHWGNKEHEGINNYSELVLEGLEPHPNLRELSIKNFMGEQFPGWFKNLSMLVRLELSNCKSFIQLPVLGHLPYLEYLRFDGLEKLSRLGESFYGIGDNIGGAGRKLFPALKTLVLERNLNLIEWKEAKEEVVVFPVLENLTIKHCPQLITTQDHFPSLKNLEIRHALIARKILSEVTDAFGLIIEEMSKLTCVSDVIGHPQNSSRPNLTHLELVRCGNVRRVWGCGTSLKKLRLIHCNNLMELPENLCEFQSLRSFEMRGCSRIQQLGPSSPTSTESFHHLTSLQEFKISYCSGLTSISGEILKGCTSLECLLVYDCPNLVSFPLDLRETTRLSDFQLRNCPKLFANNNNNIPIGFGHLTSLGSLSIGPLVDNSLFDWAGLRSCSSTLAHLSLCGLPDTESPLPEQLQHLTSLTSLYLDDFGLLEALPDWLGSLISLEELQLWNCEKLRHLPSVQAISCLTKLTRMKVVNCPPLQASLRRERGQDSELSKISHIPNLSF